MVGALPLHLALEGRRVVVVGGGPVAARKARGLLDAGAAVCVVAPYVCEELRELAAAGTVEWLTAEYRSGDLAGAWLAVAATGDLPCDAQVERDATADRIFCVRADAAAAGTARVPAVVRRDDVLITVGTDARGAADRPAGAANEPAGAADPGRSIAIRNAIAAALDAGAFPLRRHRPGPGSVVLVGGGPGDDDLLTLRARRELAAADVVVVDRLAPRGVLDELGSGVLILDVGKAPGRHPVPQHEINRLLVDHATAGRRVVRLKGGDPYLLGRGGEEVQACRDAGVPVEVVPGVSSAFAVPAAAGIPITHRGLSRSVTVVSGHDAAAVGDWSGLAGLDGTLVVLMGVAALPLITAGLLGAGKDPATPVAVIERGCTPEQQVTRAGLADVASLAAARGIESPAVIVIGEVAALGQG